MEKAHLLLKPLALSLLLFFSPVLPLLALVGGAICADTIMGVWAAYKRGEAITSNKLSNIVPKMLVYQMAILFGYVMDVYLVGEFINYIFSIPNLFTKLIALTLLSIELLSLNENIETITNKNIFRSFVKMLHRTKSVKDDMKEVSK